MSLSIAPTDRGDTIVGDAADDVIDGLGGNDRIAAGAGNDTARGGAGNDEIDGGEGVDVAAYLGSRADYTVGTVNGVAFVKHRDQAAPTGWEGNDRLANVERIEFGDATVLLRETQRPVAVDDFLRIAEDSGPVAIDVLANDGDPEGDGLVITGITDVLGGTVAVVDGTVVFTPEAGFTDGGFTYTVAEDLGPNPVLDTAGNPVAPKTSTATVVVTTNDPPVANDDFTTVSEEVTVLVSVVQNDADPDPGAVLKVTAARLLTGEGTVGIADAIGDDDAVSFTGAVDFVGEATVEYTVGDGRGGFDTGLLTITVTDAPEAVLFA